jgi:ankyrin repeat protein
MGYDMKLSSILLIIFALSSYSFLVLSQDTQQRLHILARSNNTSPLKNFLKTGTHDLNKKDKMGKTALMYAAQVGNIRHFLLLLAHGSNLSSRDNKHLNSVQYAIRNGHMQKIKLALAAVIMLGENAQLNSLS